PDSRPAPPPRGAWSRPIASSATVPGGMARVGFPVVLLLVLAVVFVVIFVAGVVLAVLAVLGRRIAVSRCRALRGLALCRGRHGKRLGERIGEIPEHIRWVVELHEVVGTIES